MTDCVIFDFDGTLADTSVSIISTTQETFRRMGVPQPPVERIRQGIGLVLEESLKFSGQLRDDQIETATRTYREIFSSNLALSVVPLFPGVKDTLEWLSARGVRMAIATSRSINSLGLIMKPHDMAKYFCHMVTASDKLTPKPAPDMVLELLKRMDQPAENCLVVGDTVFDIRMGAGAGCRTCAVSYGNHDAATLQTASPDWIINDFTKIKEII